MPSLTGKRSRIITIAAAGTLSLSGIVSAAATTLPNVASAAIRSPAATSSSVSVESPAFAHTAVITGGQGAARRGASQQRTSSNDVHLTSGIRESGHTREVAAAKPAATAAAKKAEATRATAKAAVTGSPQQVAERMLGQFGWSGSQFSCLNPLWAHESGWSVTASNPSSGAYGIAQALPGRKMASAGPDWQTNAATQIRWGLKYIQNIYGSPCAAWSHEESDGWY
jgi:hypothetical protein